MTSKPGDWIAGCTASHRRVEQTIAGLTDAQARADSRLPGWTVGHLLTHLARNADGHTHMLRAAQRGAAEPQYPGGSEQREGDIAAGQGRPAVELVSDLTAAHQRLEQAWAEASDQAWATGLRRTNDGFNTVGYAPFQRWREVEIHLLDLGLGGLTWDALSPAYVDAEWTETLAGLGRRIPPGVAILLVPGDRPSRLFGTGQQVDKIEASAARILEYVFGRVANPGWPPIIPWQ